MKFYLTRTSLWSDEEKPVKDSRVQFDDKEKLWYIELDTLEGLIDFIDEVNDDFILKAYAKRDNVRDIEIYDTWRE